MAPGGKEKNTLTLGIVNVIDPTIALETYAVIYNHTTHYLCDFGVIFRLEM